MKVTSMNSEKKVAVITGASQGIGAALVEAYRGRGYRIVAIARSIRRSDDTDILAVPGDIADRRTASGVHYASVLLDASSSRVGTTRFIQFPVRESPRNPIV